MFKLTTVHPIFDEVQANDTESVKRRVEVENHSLIGVLNANNETVAHIAVKEHNLPMLKYILSKEPSLITATDKWENNVMSVAIDEGALDIVRYLVDDLRANIHWQHRQRFGNMPIHIAAERDQTEILKYFVEEKKVHVESLNFLKETPIFLAVETPSMNALRYLVEHTKANVYALDSNKGNILYASAMKGELQVIKYLIDERKLQFDINFQDRFGRTIAYVAARFQQMPYLKYLVEEKGADINLANNMGWNALFEAAFQGHEDVVKYLAEKGADMDGKDIYNRTLPETCDEKLRNLVNELMQERLRTRRDVSQSLEQSPDPVSNNWIGEGIVERFSLFVDRHDDSVAPKVYGSYDLGIVGVEPTDTSNSFAAPESDGTSEMLVSDSSSADLLPELFPAVGGLLTLANMVVRYAKGSLPQRRYRAVLTPGEMLNARMDPEAIAAVHELPDHL